MRRVFHSAAVAAAAVAMAALLAGCPGPGSAPAGGGSGGGGKAGGKQVVTFWHTRRGDHQKALEALCAEYEAQRPEVDLQPEYQGSYDDLNKKIRASIRAKSLPHLAMAYESQVNEYAANGAIRPLDELVKDPTVGFSEAELADIHPAYLESNRYPQYQNQLLSFPFAKSNLVFYYNRDLMKKAGVTEPPATWPEFEKAAAAVSRSMGAPAWSFDIDPSTLDGMIYSFGGELLAADGKTTLFDQAPTVRMLELIQRGVREKFLVEDNADDVPQLFLAQRRAFNLGTSSARARSEAAIGTNFDWDIGLIPHAEGVPDVTVMYGGNICLFKSSPELEKAAWQFVKWFVSPEATARWSRETGYLPVRKSAIDLPEMKAFYEQNPRARHILDTLPVAKTEPNVIGWQEVRSALETAAREVIAGRKTPAAAAKDLKQKADTLLRQSN